MDFCHIIWDSGYSYLWQSCTPVALFSRSGLAWHRCSEWGVEADTLPCAPEAGRVRWDVPLDSALPSRSERVSAASASRPCAPVVDSRRTPVSARIGIDHALATLVHFDHSHTQAWGTASSQASKTMHSLSSWDFLVHEFCWFVSHKFISIVSLVSARVWSA